MPYKALRTGEAVRFEVTPDPLPLEPGRSSRSSTIGLAVLGTILVVTWKLAFIGVMILLFLAQRVFVARQFQKARNLAAAQPYRCDYAFSAHPGRLELAEANIETADIHRIAILSRGGQEGGTINLRVAATNTATGRAYERGRARMAAYYRHLAEHTYRVQVESGGVGHLIGGGLTATAANGLATDVSRAVGLG